MQFNSVAKYYTVINRLIFGSTLEKSKITLFTCIPNDARVLIIGGGSGVSLQVLVQLKPQVQIDFVEASEQMILIASNRKDYGSSVRFVHSKIEGFRGGSYDVVITEFFLDLFNKEKIEELVLMIALKLKSNGYWIDTDFRNPNNLYQKLMLKLMYIFFKITAKVRTDKLVDTKPVMIVNGLKLKKSKKFNAGFITSHLYVRP